jgi:hypothetical protein
MADWHVGDVHFLTLAQLGERYRRYRLPDPDAEAAMAGSFQRYGQLTPVIVCLRERRTRFSTVSRDLPPQGPSAKDTSTG